MKALLSFLIAIACSGSALASACTSAATGNWSAPGTWSSCAGGVPGAGDTASIGAHTVTVDANTTVGTSPNDNTTNVISLTSGSSVLTVAAGVTLTVLGNIGHVNGSTHTQASGSTVTFDNSSSGGSPVYRFQNVGFSKFNFNGSAGNVATIQAISGQTFGMGVALSQFTATYTVFRRASNLTCTNLNATTYSISDSTFDTCAKLDINTTIGTVSVILDRNTFTSGTDATDDFKITAATALSSGTRRIYGNVFSKIVNYATSVDFTITNNYFGAGFVPNASGTWRSFRLNFFKHDGTLNGGNGALLTQSVERNYFVVDNGIGNPHFIDPTALIGSVSNIVSQNIFEGHTPDLVDIGDAIIPQGVAISGSNKIIGQNNIILPMSYSGTTCTSGTLVTLYNLDATVVTEWHRNTGNVNESTLGGVAINGLFSLAEAGNGTAGQVAALKSNVAWASSSNQSYLAMRQAGNVKDIITPAGANYNWRYNTKTGDNQRGYEDKAAGNTLWTAGDAVAANVDDNQGSGNPSFYNSAVNIAAWATARGYGAGDYAAGLTALQAAPITRIPDLIQYVFEGMRPSNSAMRSAAADGGVVGAANYYKSTRTTWAITKYRTTQLAKFGL